MRSATTLAALALASFAHASPPNIITGVKCLAVNVIITVFRDHPEAVSHCSSILGISTVTVSKPTTLIHSTTITDVITTTITPVVTSTSTVVETTSVCDVSPQKRHVDYYAPPPPPPPPDCLKPFPSAQISDACSCLHLPTPTTTVHPTVILTPTSVIRSITTQTAAAVTTVETVTSTSTVHYCPAPTSCGNQGLQWAYLSSLGITGPNTDDSYSAFNPNVYKDRAPTATGITNTIGGINTPGTSPMPIYGSSQSLSTTYFVLNHRGYIYAQQTGTYTFDISGVDDALYIWFGPDAYAGWTQANANSETFYSLSGGHPGVGTFSVNLQEGQYYPVRLIFAQGDGPAVFALQVTAPDGTVFLGANTAASPYLVQYSCDGTTAPAYPAWTAEQ